MSFWHELFIQQAHSKPAACETPRAPICRVLWAVSWWLSTIHEGVQEPWKERSECLNAAIPYLAETCYILLAYFNWVFNKELSTCWVLKMWLRDGVCCLHSAKCSLVAFFHNFRPHFPFCQCMLRTDGAEGTLCWGRIEVIPETVGVTVYMLKSSSNDREMVKSI